MKHPIAVLTTNEFAYRSYLSDNNLSTDQAKQVKRFRDIKDIVFSKKVSFYDLSNIPNCVKNNIVFEFDTPDDATDKKENIKSIKKYN